ncbi:TBC1 domain family member 10A [Bagarius yarrelli]|uniref:TBC1 domain family member 10A n=1 Tax=Bagarius yarrelli TaxID=175774 RepID=A0A556UFQ0_BAGYA|nr:TBC1 domain family member 10A [Bagarius yarrelli]
MSCVRAQDVPPEVLRQRELKWLEMLKDWDKWINKKFKKEAVQLDGEILHVLLKRVCPMAYRHLDKHKIEPVLYMMEWFMCAFSRTLPWASSMLGSRDKLKACPGQYETMEVLRAIEPRYMQEAFLVHQVLEMQISARDVEREHRAQLKRWKKKRGEPSRKPPQRMHSARAIMAIEPHTRQDLRQNPTIVVQYPSIPEEKSDTTLRKKRGSMRKNQPHFPAIPNPYALPSESKPSPILEMPPTNKENHKVEVVPPTPPSYPPPNPTKQKNQVRETNTSNERLSFSPEHRKPVESLPLQHQSLPPAPEWRPHLVDSPPVLFFKKTVPDHNDVPNNTENAASILGPSTDSSPLLTHNAPANEDSAVTPEDKTGTPHNSTESINSSEDTYL